MVAQTTPSRQSSAERALERAQSEGNVAAYSLNGRWIVSSTWTSS